ncbi:Ig-like domain-containing protein, partial [bacterium]|nr:Ig-like domain-containing protein [bacterium]
MSKLNRTALFFVITALIGTGVMFLLSCTPKSPIDPTSSIGEGAAVLIDMQALPSSIAVGTSVSTVRIRLLDDSGNPLSKKKINFSTNLGTLSAVSAVTDTSGWAEVRLFAGNETGTARVSASYGKAAASVEVNIISRFEAQIQLTSTRPSILANGIDTTIIKVVVLGDSAKPVAGENVVITPSVGSISYSGTTDDQGIIKAVYTSPARKNDTTAVISAKWDTLATSNVLGLRGVTFVMESSSASILADGSSSTTIKARLKETSTNIAVPDGEVRFGTTLGSIPASAATNSSGVAEVNLTSEKKVGTAQVIGRYGGTLLDTVLVNFTKSTYSVGITASPENPLANGVDKCMITAEVRDASGSAVSGIKVKFSTSLSSMDSVAYTNSSGLAISYIKPVASTENDRTANVSIYVDGVNYSKQVTFAAVQKTVQADPNIIVADGKSTSKITVQLKRKTTQVAIYNADVVFATDKGTIENSAKTDSKGVAEATLKSDNAIGVAHVVVHYGNLPPDTTLITFTGEASGY